MFMLNRLFSMSALGLLSGLLIAPPLLAEERGATSVPVQRSPAVEKATDSKKQTKAPRQKRGGPETEPASGPNATPAEGQNDLIKVLQPGRKNNSQ